MAQRTFHTAASLVCAWLITGAGQARARQAVSMESDVAPRLARQGVLRAPLLSGAAGAQAALPASAVVDFEALNVAALRAEDTLAAQRPGVPMRVGVARAVPGGKTSPRTHGRWSTQPNGTRVWVMELRLPGATALRIHFSDVELPKGTRLVVADGDGNVIATYGGMKRVPAAPFWSATLPGEVAYVEYQDPSGRAADPTLVIDEVLHVYHDAGLGLGRRGTAAAAQGVLPCEEDVMCHSVDTRARDSVGRIFFVSGGGGFVCSGGLLNDADPNTFAGYFLTANHCISTQAEANSMEVLWFFQTNVCNGTPSVGAVSSGGTVLATSASTDFTLIRLDDDPSDGQGFAAWWTGSISSTVRGIHHPAGSHKRYSEGFLTNAQPICAGVPLSRYVYNDWTLGTIEGGSSGSPLFDSSWRVVGQLLGTCGSTAGCANPQLWNTLYGRFSVSFSSMSSFLNSVTPDDGFEDNDTLPTAAVLPLGTHALRLVDFDDYFQITLTETSLLSATATFATSEMDLDLQLLASDGTELDISDGSTATEAVSAIVAPGDYFVRAMKSGGWGGDYSLTLTTEPRACVVASTPQSDVVASKNRYLSFVAGDPGQLSAIRITFTSAPGSNPDLTGQTAWVAAPQLVSENGGSINPLPGFPDFQNATLSCSPVFMDWSGLGTVHVYHQSIAPGFEFSIQAVVQDCPLTDEANFSPPLTLAQSRWGDATGSFDSINRVWTAPDGVVDVTSDVIAIIDKFAGRGSAPIKARVDIEPAVPDQLINISDATRALDAFRGRAYPFDPGPPPCP